MEIENYLLTKNDFELCTTGAFKNLINETEFADVTLACPDEKQVDAHKVILSACSPFFRKILLKNRKKDQLIYLKGILHRDLMSIIQFMYTGQTKVCKEDLDGFLLAAQELQVEGLVYSEQNKTKIVDKDLEKKVKVDEIKRKKFEHIDENVKPPESVKPPPLKKEPKTPKKTKATNVSPKSDFKCEECQLYLQNQNHFDVHNEMLHRKSYEQPKEPKQSDNTTPTEIELKIEPLDISNNSVPDETEKAAASKDYTCETDGCDFATRSRDELKAHILSLHLGLKKYSPAAIAEESPETEEESMEIEERTASPDSETENSKAIVPFTDPTTKPKPDRADLERRFFCEICDFGTAHKFNLKRHMTNIHGITTVDGTVSDIYTDEDILGADISLEESEKKMSAKKRRTVDLENVDPSQLFSCDRCDFTTTHIKSKRRHMMVIHEGLRHPCNYCSFQATQPYDVKKHIMKKHPEKL